MTLAKHLISTFPDPPPYLDRVIDETLVAELLPDQPRRVNHIMGVVARGRELAAQLSASPDLARQIDQVTLAHDIGYAGALNRVGFHPLDGAIFLAHRGAEDDVIHAVLHHSGAREGAKAVAAAAPFYSDLPAFAPTFLSDAITFCDTQTSPEGARVTIAERVREVEERYGADSATGRSMRMMEPEFSEIHRRVSAIIVDRARLPGYAAGMHGSIHPRLSGILSLGVLLATLSACAPHYTDSDPPPPHWAPNPNPFQVPP